MPEIFTIFDTETTGLSPYKGDRLIEIAALQIIDGEVSREEFVTLINPERNIPAEATKVNGITSDMVKNAPKAHEVLAYFMEFIGNSTIVAHNAQFDLRFLSAELKKANLLIPLPDHQCTLEISRELFPYQKLHNLDAVCMRLGIDTSQMNRHRALDDVILTAKVFMRFQTIKKKHRIANKA